MRGGKTVVKGEFNNIVICLCKLQHHNFFDFGTYQPCVNISPNSAFILENNLKPTLHLVKKLDALFPIYKQKKGGCQNTPSLLSTEDFLKRSNEKAIDLDVIDNCYPNFVPFIMDKFERHLYI